MLFSKAKESTTDGSCRLDSASGSRSRSDLRIIARRDRRLSVAKDVVIKLRDHCENYTGLIAEGHELGTLRNDLGLGIKIFSHQRWVIAFRANDNGMEVLRIFDGSREYKYLFQGELNE